MKLSSYQKIAVKKFNKRISNNEIKFEQRNCLCGSTDGENIFTYDRYGLWHPTMICKKCGLIFSNPQLSDNDYSAFYSSDEYRLLYSDENYIETSEMRYKDSNQIFDTMLPYMNTFNFKTVLEFGCGGGWNLIPFYNNGYDVTGYDYSHNLIKLGRRYGLNLKQGSFQELNDTTKKYDVIILNHVIEHFTDIKNNINSILKCLEPNGFIYISVPNIDNFSHGQFQNAHVYYFTPRTFIHYMNELSLQTVEFDLDESIHMHGVFKISSIDIKNNSKLLLASEYPFMRYKILQGKIKSKIVLLLEILRVKEWIKKLIRISKS